MLAEAYATTGNKAFARHQAGMSAISGNADKALQRPAVQAEIARVQLERLFNEALPAAVSTIVSILNNDKAPAGARVQASKVVFDRTLGRDEAFKGKDPHEMTPDELAKAIDELKRLAADKAKPVLELEASAIDDSDQGGDIFE
ncbi:hypothetical protein [Aminobacter sp. BE322]|uniref:hypothetical protein n=1 Tax=unclassified Aminobacter TaxID=2644704 RepID=UPI003D221AF3